MAKIFKKKKNSKSEGNEQVFRLIHNAMSVKEPKKNWSKINIRIEQI